MRVELHVALDDALRDAVLIELRQALDGFHVHAADIDELLADLLELLVLGFDERKQGGAALVHERVVIEGDLADLVEGLAVAEDDVELTGLILRGDGRLRQGRDEGIPGGRLGRLAPTFQGFGDAGDDLGLAVGHLRGVGEEFVQGFGLLVRGFGDATGDQLGDLRDAADMRAGDEVGERELTDARPDEERQVMVRGVLVEAQEVLGDERAHGDGKMRQGRSDRQTDALAAGFAGKPEERGFAGFLGGDEAGVVAELGQ